jgi:hypothetical protein
MDLRGWRAAVKTAQADRRLKPVVAESYVRTFPGVSRSVLVECDDGQPYVIKGLNSPGRTAFTEQVVGRLGKRMGAPVATVELVSVTRELTAAEPAMAHVAEGFAHGSLYIDNVSDDRQPVAHFEKPENRPRFARLALLYGMCFARDHQFLYDNKPPRLVHSVDHGYFLPGGPHWTAEALAGAPAPFADNEITTQCSLTPDELREAVRSLKRLRDADVALAVAFPPDEWNVSLEERKRLAAYLGSRRDALIQQYG